MEKLLKMKVMGIILILFAFNQILAQSAVRPVVPKISESQFPDPSSPHYEVKKAAWIQENPEAYRQLAGDQSGLEQPKRERNSVEAPAVSGPSMLSNTGTANQLTKSLPNRDDNEKAKQQAEYLRKKAELDAASKAAQANPAPTAVVPVSNTK